MMPYLQESQKTYDVLQILNEPESSLTLKPELKAKRDQLFRDWNESCEAIEIKHSPLKHITNLNKLCLEGGVYLKVRGTYVLT